MAGFASSEALGRSLIGSSPVNRSSISAANGAASISSLRQVVISNVSRKVASLSSFSSVSSATVTGDTFASLYATGNVLLSSLTATTGAATALVLGSVGSAGVNFSMDAGTDAMLSGLGNVDADVTAGASVLVFSVGNFTGSLTAARIAQAMSYGSMDVTVSGTLELLELISVGDLTVGGSVPTARIATFGDLTATSSLTSDQLPFLWVLGDLVGSVTTDQLGGVRVFGDLTGTVTETGATVTSTSLPPPSGATLVTPLNFGTFHASGVQVLHDLTGTVTVVGPLPVVVGGSITGTVSAAEVRVGDRSSFQEQPEVPFAEVGEVIADSRDGSQSLRDLQDELVAAATSLVQATVAAMVELGQTLATANAEVSDEQSAALERMVTLKSEESVSLTAALDAAERALTAARGDVTAASKQAEQAINAGVKEQEDAKEAMMQAMSATKAAADDEKFLTVAIANVSRTAHTDEVTVAIAKYSAQAAQRPEAWAEQASNLGSLAADMAGIGLSIVGVFDPTGIADGLNAFISLARGEYEDAAMSIVSMLPGGDVTKGLMQTRAMRRVANAFRGYGRAVVNAAATVNRRIDCNDVNRIFRTLGTALGRCFVGDTLVLVGEFEHGQTLAMVDAEICTELPLLASQESDSRWPALLWLVVGVAGVVIVSDRKKNQVPVLTLPKRGPRLEPVGDPPDDPLPLPLTPEDLDALCDELFCPQSSRPTPWDERRTLSNNHRPMTMPKGNQTPTSPVSLSLLAVAETPIIRTKSECIDRLPVEPPQRRRSALIFFAGVCATFFGILAVSGFFGLLDDPAAKHVVAKPLISANAETPPVLFTPQPQKRFVAKPIRDIFPIADRVIAKNPESERDDVELTDAKLDEIEAELMELIDNEPLPMPIDGLSDEDKFAFNDDELADETTDTEPTKAEQLYNELLVAAETLNSQPSTLNQIEHTDFGPFVHEHWRVIHFLLTRLDGDKVRIWLARPTWWLEEEQVKVGGKYEFDMEEVGAVGTADVVAIDECQQPPNRQNEHHRLVTGKFKHQAKNVIDLYVEGQDEPIGTTANHPFWSEDRQAFVEAGSLRPGENLLNVDGQRVQVITHSPRPGPYTVYNLEVDGEHVYRVGEDGVLVHNACSGTSGNSVFTSIGMARHALHARVWKSLGYTVKTALPSGKIPDAFRLITRNGKVVGAVILELKPDNARAVARGVRQLERYAKEISKTYRIPMNKIMKVIDTYR